MARLQRRTLAAYLPQITMLGSYLARNHDPPPGNMVVWRGMTRLHDIAFGISRGLTTAGVIEIIRSTETKRVTAAMIKSGPTRVSE